MENVFSVLAQELDYANAIFLPQGVINDRTTRFILPKLVETLTIRDTKGRHLIHHSGVKTMHMRRSELLYEGYVEGIRIQNRRALPRYCGCDFKENVKRFFLFLYEKYTMMVSGSNQVATIVDDDVQDETSIT
ncbi:hypothetical protein HAX54_006694, partial [Datura stramonium]|nr:hypothetical protein [Datura stramonium]